MFTELKIAACIIVINLTIMYLLKRSEDPKEEDED